MYGSPDLPSTLEARGDLAKALVLGSSALFQASGNKGRHCGSSESQSGLASVLDGLRFEL